MLCAFLAPACGIDKHQIAGGAGGERLTRLFGRKHDMERQSHNVGEGPDLFYGGNTVRIRRNNRYGFSFVKDMVCRELGKRRCLSHARRPDEHDDDGFAGFHPGRRRALEACGKFRNKALDHVRALQR